MSDKPEPMTPAWFNALDDVLGNAYSECPTEYAPDHLRAAIAEVLEWAANQACTLGASEGACDFEHRIVSEFRDQAEVVRRGETKSGGDRCRMTL